MKRKSILALTLIATLSISTFIIGCGDSSSNNSTNSTNSTEDVVDEDRDGIEDKDNNDNDMANDVKNGTEAAKDGVERVGNDIKYTSSDFKNDITNAGHEIKESMDNKKAYFTGTETSYMLGNDMVRVYEYDSVDNLNEDISTISSDGMTINGKDTEYTSKPYYYTKGNTLIVYEGSDPTYIDYFNNTYGNTII